MKGQVSLLFTFHLPTEVTCAHVTLEINKFSHHGQQSFGGLYDSLSYHLTISEYTSEAILTSECLSRCHRAFEDGPDRNPGYKEITGQTRPQEDEAKGSQVQDLPWLQSEFKASLSCLVKPCLKNLKKYKKGWYSSVIVCSPRWTRPWIHYSVPLCTNTHTCTHTCVRMRAHTRKEGEKWPIERKKCMHDKSMQTLIKV